VSKLLFGAVAALALLAVSSAQAGVDISTKATQNMSCANGVCSPTAQKAVLNVNDVTGMLATGDLKITTGSGALDIRVKAPFSWTSTSHLTLDANCSLGFSKAVTVAGSGALTLTTNDGGSCGNLLFTDRGRVIFWDLKSNLVINGSRYKLVGSISTLASAIKHNSSGDFALANSYDAKPDGVYSGAPVSASLSGHFEGLGNTILHLTISDESGTDNVGLFDTLLASSIVENLRLAKVHIKGATQSRIGSLAGAAYGTIRNVVADGMIAGANGTTGGLVGANKGDIIASRTNGTVNGGGDAGGLVGFADFGSAIEESSSSSAVTGSGVVGGLVGEIGEARLIDASSATGPVTSQNDQDFTYVGGFVGWTDGSWISRCFATGPVHAKTEAVAGGFAGIFEASAGTAGGGDDYATGPVTTGAPSYLGGFAGWMGGEDLLLGTSYSTGAVSGTGSFLGGFVGYDFGAGFGIIEDLYWDLDTSGISDPSQGAGNIPNDPGITGLTDAQLKSALPNGFDPKIWGQDPNINNGYPYLLANPPPK